MSKRRIHHILEGAEDVIAENAEHEGHPRTSSAERAQESWEEFKEKSNQAAEAALEEITHPTELRTRMNKAIRRARGFYMTYKTYVWIAGALGAAGLAYAITAPIVKKRNRFKISVGLS
jgi:hypothetical protein